MPIMSFETQSHYKDKKITMQCLGNCLDLIVAVYGAVMLCYNSSFATLWGNDLCNGNIFILLMWGNTEYSGWQDIVA